MILYAHNDKIQFMKNKKFASAGAVVLGMHDALVSLTGLISGLTFAQTDRRFIILSAIIASVAAGLSMAASNYLAEKTDGNLHPLRAGAITGIAYLMTCALLVMPYLIIPNTKTALIGAFIIAILMIFGCNVCIGYARKRKFWRHAIEMLIICTGVSIVAFVIGEVAKNYLGL